MLETHLLKRIDRPSAWVQVFGGGFLVVIGAVGYARGGLGGELKSIFADLVAGSLVGLAA